MVEAGSCSVSRVAGQWADSRRRARDVAGNGREEGQAKGKGKEGKRKKEDDRQSRAEAQNSGRGVVARGG